MEIKELLGERKAEQFKFLLTFVFFGSMAAVGCQSLIASGQDEITPGRSIVAPVTAQKETDAATSVTLSGTTPSSTLTEAPTTSAHSPTPTAFDPSETPEPYIVFAVIGDYGLSEKPEREVADLVKSWNPDFIITVGDNNYPDGQFETIDENIGQYYHEFIFPYFGEFGDGSDVNRFFPALGNHDLTTADGQPYFDFFTLPGNERYYDFVWGPVHFFALNSDSREPDGVGRSSIQAEWLKKKMIESSSPWKIVYMHHPPYSSSGDGSISWIQWPFQEWRADAVLTGHSHVYERLIVDGFPYFINGLGGGVRYDFDEPVAGSKVRFRDEYGAMLVAASLNHIVFQFITCDNILIDAYEMDK